MKLQFIFNPHSGRPRTGGPILPLLKRFVAERCPQAVLTCTEGPGHATEIAREAAASGCQRVVAIGGDGTVNEIAQALVHTPVTMGLVPRGSGNGLARHLCLPKGLWPALELASGSRGREAALDTGTVNGLTFVNAMGLGLDAEVAGRFNRLGTRGLPAYARTAFSAFLSRKTERCKISYENRQETVDMLLIAVANSDQYGNNARIAPRARVDDGLLDLIVVEPVGLFSAGILAARLFCGSLDRSRRVRRLKGAKFLIERPTAGPVHTDGETHSAGACVEVAVRPHSLRFIVPADCRGVRPNLNPAASGFALQFP